MIKTTLRKALRSLAVRILVRPALAEPFKNLIRRFPALDRRLRRIVHGGQAVLPAGAVPQGVAAGAPQPPAPVPPEVARVLADLRRALQERERRAS
jgi:hypothetical protein